MHVLKSAGSVANAAAGGLDSAGAAVKDTVSGGLAAVPWGKMGLLVGGGLLVIAAVKGLLR
jgi:hypothetical protein